MVVSQPFGSFSESDKLPKKWCNPEHGSLIIRPLFTKSIAEEYPASPEADQPCGCKENG